MECVSKYNYFWPKYLTLWFHYFSFADFFKESALWGTPPKAWKITKITQQIRQKAKGLTAYDQKKRLERSACKALKQKNKKIVKCDFQGLLSQKIDNYMRRFSTSTPVKIVWKVA